MKKTVYFKELSNYANTIQIVDQLINKKDDFLLINKDKIAKIDSEDLRVDSLGNNQNICIIRLTYYVK